MAERAMSPGPGPSLGTLIRELLDDIAELLRQEVRLARAEAGEALERLQTGAVMLVSGLLLGFCALLLLLQALVVALSNVMQPWLATSLVAVGVAAIALVLIWLAQRRLRLSAVYPRRTVQSVQDDTDMIKRKIR